MDIGIQRKKLLLVIGKTGVGKSSFVAELVSQKDGDLDQGIDIKREAGINSVTEKCQIFKVHPAHNLLDNQDLYIMDTPGLDSEESACLITEMIDRVLIRQQDHRYQIIGISYLITVQGGPRQNCYIQKFLQVLKLKWAVKSSLIFCVISQWDITEFLKKIKKNQINKIMNEWKNYLIDLELGVCWEKLVKWSSTPVENDDKNNFIEYSQSLNGKYNIKQQWNQLKSNLELQYQFRQSFQLYASEYQLFWQNVSELTQKQFQVKQNVFQKVKVSFQIKLKSDGSINNTKTKTTKLSLGLLAGAAFISSAIFDSLSRFLAAILGSFFTIGTIMVDFPDINIKQMKGLLKGKLQKKLYEQVVKRLILQYIKNDLFKNAICSPDGIKFQKCSMMSSLKVFEKLPLDDFRQIYHYSDIHEGNEDPPQVLIDMKDKGQEKYYEFQFDFRVPTFSRIVQILKIQSERLYGKKSKLQK